MPLMSIWSLRCRMCVSSCRCVIGVVRVQPVAMRKALFCVVCSFLMWVWAMSGCHAVCAYVSTGLMYCLYILVVSSLECPYVVWVRARMTFSLVLAFVLMLSVCCLKVIPLSSVSPRMVIGRVIVDRDGIVE